jgi:FkbM family methyltransferase
MAFTKRLSNKRNESSSSSSDRNYFQSSNSNGDSNGNNSNNGNSKNNNNNKKYNHHHHSTSTSTSTIRNRLLSIIPIIIIAGLLFLFVVRVGTINNNNSNNNNSKQSPQEFIGIIGDVDGNNNNSNNVNVNVNVKKKEILYRPKYCSNAQLDKIYSTFKTPFVSSSESKTNAKNTNIRFHTPIMKRTHCPNEIWVREYFQNKNRRKQNRQNSKDGKNSNSNSNSFLGINVGCNKGLDAIEMARLLSHDTNISVNDWNNALTTLSTSKSSSTSKKAVSRPLCGIPHDMTFPETSSETESGYSGGGYGGGGHGGGGHVHCIEPMPSTVEILKHTLNKLGYDHTIIVTKAAMSNYTGTTLFPNSDSGTEGKSLKHCEGVDVTSSDSDSDSDSSSCVKVPVYSLDDYMQEQEQQQQQQQQEIDSNNNNNNNIDPNPNPNPIPIDMLLIDAEGYDYEVLQGATETLKRVTYLLFEVHIVGNWMVHSLSETIDTILSDFICYWAGNNQLWRITNCINKDLEELYEYKSWSNIACVHQREIELVNIMENVFKRTIA